MALAATTRINGGTGKDKLYGGAGQDTFVFDTPVKKGHFDHIEDFKASDDTIQISLAALKAFKVKGPKASDVISKKGSDDGGKPDKNSNKSVGFDKIFKKGQKLEKKFFNVGTKLGDNPDGSNDYVFYNKKNGFVYLGYRRLRQRQGHRDPETEAGDDAERRRLPVHLTHHRFQAPMHIGAISPRFLSKLGKGQRDVEGLERGT